VFVIYLPRLVFLKCHLGNQVSWLLPTHFSLSVIAHCYGCVPHHSVPLQTDSKPLVSLCVDVAGSLELHMDALYLALELVRRAENEEVGQMVLVSQWCSLLGWQGYGVGGAARILGWLRERR
jgi:hypothetical protein